MKKLFTLLCLSTVLFASCVGPEGPPGLNGLDGLDGTEELAQVYEIENIDFIASEDYATRFFFPQNIFDSDVVLVYRLESVTNDLDVWEPLPSATIFFDDGGYLQYRFNFTSGDVDVLLESDDPTLLGPEYTTNQVFRIVVVPAEFANNAGFDSNDIDTVMSFFKIDDSNVKTIELN